MSERLLPVSRLIAASSMLCMLCLVPSAQAAPQAWKIIRKDAAHSPCDAAVQAADDAFPPDGSSGAHLRTARALMDCVSYDLEKDRTADPGRAAAAAADAFLSLSAERQKELGDPAYRLAELRARIAHDQGAQASAERIAEQWSEDVDVRAELAWALLQGAHEHPHMSAALSELARPHLLHVRAHAEGALKARAESALATLEEAEPQYALSGLGFLAVKVSFTRPSSPYRVRLSSL